jgi:SAM-dependent methyltransferase
MGAWWKTFFDADYIRIWRGGESAAESADEARAIWDLLALHEGSRVLDAPCGYGRLALPIAQRGATVVGVDQSEVLLAQAEKDRGDLPPERLRYRKHDLRQPLPEAGFDAAMNIFSSIGYGSEEEDRAIFRTLSAAVRPGGRVLLETMHRDTAVAFFSRGARPSQRLPDGTLVIEEPTFDPFSGRVNTAWYWFGPSGQGSKSASLRMYTVTELIALLDAVGLRFLSAHPGCSTEAWKASGPEMGGRIAILTERVE